MGKKSKFKKRLNYSRQQFVRKVCLDKCGLCVEGNPEFCYTMYEKDPHRFMKFGINTIIKSGAFVQSILKGNKELKDCSDDEIQYIFEEFFCNSRVCGNTSKRCKELVGCLATFKKQLVGDPDIVVVTTRIKPKKKGGKYTIQRNPTPTFFCNEKFEEEIKRILYGDNPEEQDKTEECSSLFDKCFNGGASNS